MRVKEFLGEQKYIQAQLLYPKNGLEPVMSKETIDYHHGHLHKSYVDRANKGEGGEFTKACLLYTSPSPRDLSTSRMPSSA